MRTNIIQSTEQFGPPERRAELREVWRRNEGLFDRYTNFDGRPNFAELFAMCLPDHINIICNADIYFDAQALRHIRQFYAEGNDHVVMCLSRWDILPDGTSKLWDHADSADTWVVKGGPHVIPSEFPMGKAGCDNRLAHDLQEAGYLTTNPSKTIQTFHLHRVNYRSYLVDPTGIARGGNKIERIPPPYAFVQPTEL